MRNVIRGIIMGITDLIPGISGGTIAMVLGIYHELLASINGVFSKDWRKHLLFLAPLLLGIGIALVSFSRLIEWLIINHSQPLFFFFNGLILGIIPFLLRTANYKKTFQVSHYTLLIIAAILVASTSLIHEGGMQEIWTNLSLSEYIFLFFSGWLASSAMILPGISGSLIFLLLGVYPTVINAISTLNLTVILVTGLGIVFGIIITSKLVQFLLLQFSTLTYSVMIGLVFGSLIVTFPGLPATVPYTILCIALFLTGSILAIMLGRFEHKNKLPKITKKGSMV
nr:DUF368 domain-containing protein [Anaerobacillus isosaccharinicus]QOY38586.1 DUF368 domain-containing protein [Anaerobacillus isosaccharinicus]